MSRTPPSSSLAERILAGDRTMLGRAVSIAENGGDQWQKLQELLPPTGNAAVVGLTGGAGSGKSTLIDSMIGRLRARNLRVGIAAIDPSSPFSGGAVLGDRCRMGRHQGDPGVYIRSLSARGSVGGLSAGAGRVIDTLKRSPFDLILIETVGAGQSEVDILELADVCAVICTPNSGDDIQALKSGILEIADVLIVNKADLADADRSIQQLKLAQNLPSNAPHKVPVMSTVATEGRGIDPLVDFIMELADPERHDRRNLGNTTQVHRRIAHAISAELQQRLLDSEEGGLDHLCQRVLRGECSVDTAARLWLDKNFL